MHDLPQGWRSARIGDIAQVVGGGTPSRSEPRFWNGDILWATPSDVTALRSRVLHETASTITEAGLEASAAKLLPSGTVLLTSRATIGACAIVRTPLATNQGFQSLVPGPDVDGEYLYYAVQSSRPSLERLASGSTFREVSRASVRSVRVSLPPMAEQRKIAATLKAVDDATEADEAVVQQLDRVQAQLEKHLLGHGLRGSKINWVTETIGARATVVRGATPRPAKDPRYFNGDHAPWITVSEISKDDWPHLTATATRLTVEGAARSRQLRKGTVVLINSGFGLGVPKILALSGCANDGVAAFLDLAPSVDPLFFYYALKVRTEWFRRSVARGVDQPNLNTRLISEVRVEWPPRSEQAEIASCLFECDERRRAERMHLDQLRSVKSALADALLSGRLRVRDAA